MDGTRWLPSPDEQLHRVGAMDRAESTPEPDTPSPLEQHDCKAAVCSVIKTFETTELLEAILCFLDRKDVISLRRTTKRWDSLVHSSPFLRLHFYNRPQWKRPPSSYQLLPLSIPGITIENGEPIHLGRWIQVTMTPEAAKRICPEPRQRVRSRSIFEGLRGGLGRSSNDAWPAGTATEDEGGSLKREDLYIVQPPLLGMQARLIRQVRKSDPERLAAGSAVSRDIGGVAEVSDEAQSPHEPPAIAKLSCDAGITLGFLAETAQELLGPRTSGPSNAGDVKIVFKAIISFGAAEISPRATRRQVRTVMRIG